MPANLYMPVPARIEEIVDETPTIKTFVMKPEEPIVFEAGQFVEVTVPGLGEAPFTPAAVAGGALYVGAGRVFCCFR